MTEKVKRMYDIVRLCEYRKERINNENYDLTDAYMSDPVNSPSIFLEDMLNRETPYILDGDIFGFNRRNVYCPYYVKDGKRKKIIFGNITPNYARIIERGFEGVLDDIEKYEKINLDDASQKFYSAMRRNVAAVLDICRRYEECARESGNERLAQALSYAPKKGARSFYEACLIFKIISYTLHCVEHVHITIGRFDQYMYPYFKGDIEK
jgi:formate C-acetyltransferase